MTYSRSVTHSEEWWANHAPAHVLRCVGTYKSTGTQCRRVAVDGSVVCGHHGGTSPQVVRRAAERVQFTADDAARQLVEMMSDPQVDARERVKIAQDLLDRAGLAAAQVHKVLPITQDPIEKLFTDILGSDGALLQAEPERAPALPAAPSDVLSPSEVERPLSREADAPASDPPPRESDPQPVVVPRHIREALKELL